MYLEVNLHDYIDQYEYTMKATSSKVKSYNLIIQSKIAFAQCSVA